MGQGFTQQDHYSLMMLEEPLVDCQDALRAYEELWSGLGRRRVLSLVGMSGTGKSTLLRYLAARESWRPSAMVDLAELPLREVDVVGALLDQLCPEAGARGAATITMKAGPFGTITSSPVTVIPGNDLDLSGLDCLRSREWLLCVDHCDELDAVPQVRRWLVGRLVPRLLGSFPGLRVVMAGESGPYGPVQERLSHRLWTWTHAESTEYLARWGLVDQAAAARLHEAFDGLGLFLALARQAWAGAEESGRSFDLADSSGERMNAWLFDRVLAAVPAAAREALRSALRLRWFSGDVLGALGASSGFGDVAYRALTVRSWVRSVPGGGHAVDPLVRFAYAGWCRAERPEELRGFHSRALEVFEARGAVLDVIYHLLTVDPEAGITAWVGEFDRADASGRAALARLARLPEVWAWLPRQGRDAWYARSGAIGLAGIRLGADAFVASSHVDTMRNQVANVQQTETTPPVIGFSRRDQGQASRA